MSSVPERRSSLRLKIPLKMEVGKAGGADRVGFKIEVVVSNVSASGAYFETEHWRLFEIGATVNVTIHLPKDSNYEALGFPKLRTSARVLRKQAVVISLAKGGSREVRGVAIKFDNPLSFI
jgi:hypothetical protein